MVSLQRAFSVPAASALTVALLASGQGAASAAGPGSQPHGLTVVPGGIPALSPATAVSIERVALPLKPQTYRFSSRYGARCIPVIGGSTYHLGQDLGAANNDPIYAVANGVVTRTSNGTANSSGYIVVKHVLGGKTFHTVYVHMWKATTHVAAGSVVKAGQQIGLVGNSGPSTGPHLHFEVWEGAWYTGKSLDATAWLKARGVDLAGNASRIYPDLRPTSCSYYAASTLNLRSAPTASSQILSTLAVNTPMRSIPGEISNGYVRVTANGFTGWVLHSGVSPYKVAGKPSPPPQQEAGSPDEDVVPSGQVGSGTTTVAGTYSANSGVNIRSQASTGSAVLKVLPKGAKATVSADLNGWYKVSYAGTVGWVYSSYLTRVASAPTAPAPTTPAPTTPAKAATHRTTVNLNLRSGAGGTHAVIRVLPKGTAVAALSAQGTWSKVASGTTAGWVASEFLQKIAAPAPAKPPVTKPVTQPAAPKPPVATPAPKPAPKPVAKPVVTLQTSVALNLRAGMGTTFKVLKVLPKNTKVTQVAVKGTWTQVKHGTSTGWVSTRYVAKAPTTAKPVTKALKAAKFRTTTKVNVRKGPDHAQSIVKILQKGAAVTVNASNGSWRRVVVGSTVGWVPATQLTAATTASAAKPAAATASKTRTTTARVNLRTGASTAYRAVVVLPANAKVTSKATKGLWVQVTYGSKTGWVHGAYLK